MANENPPPVFEKKPKVKNPPNRAPTLPDMPTPSLRNQDRPAARPVR